MAKKKSGAQRAAWKRWNDNPASAFHGILRSNKRGRPKGETEPVEARRKMIELDLCWLQAGGVLNANWTDRKIVNELLLDDPTRWEKYKLGECQYRGVHKPTLRRYIAAARKRGFGKIIAPLG